LIKERDYCYAIKKDLIERRHKIVHGADRTTRDQLNPINTKEVEKQMEMLVRLVESANDISENLIKKC